MKIEFIFLLDALLLVLFLLLVFGDQHFRLTPTPICDDFRKTSTIILIQVPPHGL